jgi:N-acetylglutamate synthase-like GNAT family acetyltransferase
MTDDMLELARRNAAQAGVANVEFLKGQIEEIPLPDASVDVIISNCVINLSGDKRQVFAEAFRVLKPGGRFAVSDVVVRGDLPPAIRESLELWVGCVAGALEEQEFVHLLGETGFEQVAIEPTRIYRSDDSRGFLEDAGLVDQSLEAIDGRIMASFIRATKPLPSPIKVRSATGADLPHVERLLRGSGLPTEGVPELIATHPADFLVGEVAAADGSPHTVAVAGLEVHGPFALLRSTAVDPTWRAQGVGDRLTRGLIALAESRSVEALYLLTTTAEDYFPRFGFTRVSRDEVPEAIAATSEFRTACPQSAAVMMRVVSVASQRSAHASP